jgi:hypothetical protein
MDLAMEYPPLPAVSMPISKLLVSDKARRNEIIFQLDAFVTLLKVTMISRVFIILPELLWNSNSTRQRLIWYMAGLCKLQCMSKMTFPLYLLQHRNMIYITFIIHTYGIHSKYTELNNYTPQEASGMLIFIAILSSCFYISSSLSIMQRCYLA